MEVDYRSYRRSYRRNFRIPYKPEKLSGFLFATVKVASITAMIYFHIKNMAWTNLNWKNCEIVGLSSSNLQVTISRVLISVLKGRRKLGRLRDFCVPVGPLYSFPGPDEKLCVAFTFHFTISDRKFYCKVYIFFKDRHIIGKPANDNLFCHSQL